MQAPRAKTLVFACSGCSFAGVFEVDEDGFAEQLTEQVESRS